MNLLVFWKINKMKDNWTSKMTSYYWRLYPSTLLYSFADHFSKSIFEKLLKKNRYVFKECLLTYIYIQIKKGILSLNWYAGIALQQWNTTYLHNYFNSFKKKCKQYFINLVHKKNFSGFIFIRKTRSPKNWNPRIYK